MSSISSPATRAAFKTVGARLARAGCKFTGAPGPHTVRFDCADFVGALLVACSGPDDGSHFPIHDAASFPDGRHVVILEVKS